ncbi:transcriptional regulator, IclR family, C-terminal domain protein [Bordetella hinzii CA90 BAL1384]|uniref:IclR family transcriptional regulator domain-containing protein n=1 Tax=Bordetella hinzii TaxID=103855 RepID=UPI00045A8FF9|nr:IclR family transcriptional regulator C-terminal domain-containing protein [Bordetella hinzii]KCB27712.1 transcriptional regulator, IclR family, C-terminal domain protein [Bordetella hinzii CA90 BAL1384]KCB45726.1 transcriptional regulator, IclR family, C-terminal domain protein [Bordetella hinzii 5132]QDJ46441.1 hypothetical protein CBR71_11745 [Bordetella hinzii]QII86874.1 helix-turn-helix domain-containing protein [Bordetella hinzii]
MSNNDSSSPAYRYNKSLVKGLSLLVELNRSSSASCTITELANATGQHRTTVKRLLETLKEAGYVEHDVATNMYRLTFRVQQLSYGYRDTTLVTEVAWPYMRKFSQKVVWPCSLVAPEGDEMVVRLSTRPYSRLSFHPGMPGRRMPMFSTSAGRAYLAYASDAARETIVDMLRARVELAHELTAGNVRALTEQTRARGYAMNIGEWRDEPKFGAYAVPIRGVGGEAIVVLNVVFLNAAMTQPEPQKALLQALFETARQIEIAYAESVGRLGPASRG